MPSVHKSESDNENIPLETPSSQRLEELRIARFKSDSVSKRSRPWRIQKKEKNVIKTDTANEHNLNQEHCQKSDNDNVSNNEYRWRKLERKKKRSRGKSDKCVKSKGHLYKFKCLYCDFIAINSDYLKKHTRVIHRKGELLDLTSNNCKVRESIATKYSRNIKERFFVSQYGNQALYQCTYCEFETNLLKSYKKHSKKHKTHKPIRIHTPPLSVLKIRKQYRTQKYFPRFLRKSIKKQTPLVKVSKNRDLFKRKGYRNFETKFSMYKKPTYNYYKCVCCGEICISWSMFQKHFDEVHSRKICPICDPFISHILKINPICLGTLKLIQHIDSYHKRVNCSICEIRGLSYKKLLLHIERIHSINLCPKCGKETIGSAFFKKHMAVAHNVQVFAGCEILMNYYCPLCNLAAHNWNNFHVHLEAKHRPYEICELNYNSQTKHSNSTDRFAFDYSVNNNVRCPICGSQITRGYYSRHFASHDYLFSKPLRVIYFRKTKQNNNRYPRKQVIFKKEVKAHDQVTNPSKRKINEGRETKYFYYCPCCIFRHEESRRFIIHIRRAHPIYICLICKENTLDLRQHVEKAHRNIKNECEYCEIPKTLKKKKLLSHFQNEHSTFECFFCDSIIDGVVRYEFHLYEHINICLFDDSYLKVVKERNKEMLKRTKKEDLKRFELNNVSQEKGEKQAKGRVVVSKSDSQETINDHVNQQKNIKQYLKNR